MSGWLIRITARFLDNFNQRRPSDNHPIDPAKPGVTPWGMDQRTGNSRLG
jgi:hypothetical protein